MKFVEHRARRLPGGGALDVDGGGGWDVPDLPAATLQPEAKVEVFAVHEEVRVEESDLVDRLPAHQEAGCRSGVNLGDGVRRHLAEVVSIQSRVVGKQLAETAEAEECREWGRERAPCGQVQAAAGSFQSRTGCAGVLVGVEKLRELRH